MYLTWERTEIHTSQSHIIELLPYYYVVRVNMHMYAVAFNGAGDGHTKIGTVSRANPRSRVESQRFAGQKTVAERVADNAI